MSARATTALTAVLVLAIGLPIVFARKSWRSEVVATTVDAQDFDQLWLDLEALQQAKLNGADFERRFVARTAKYLQLGDAAVLVGAVALALGDLEQARSRMERALASSNGTAVPTTEVRRKAWGRWQEEQRAASDRLLAALQTTPRHGLLAEKRLLWLLRLDYSKRGQRKAR